MTTIADIAFAPQVPWAVIAVLGLVAMALVAYGAFRRTSGVTWRTFALLAGLITLANPSLVTEDREMLPDVAVLVVDHSQSQRIGERLSATEDARQAIEVRLARLENLDVRLVTVGHPAGQTDQATAPSGGTHLFAALDQALLDTPRDRLAGAIVLTDGQVHDVPDEDRRLRYGPLHVLLTGQRGERDRRVIVDQAPSYGIVGKPLTLRLRIEDSGGEAAAAGSSSFARVTLRRDGADETVHAVPTGVGHEIPLSLDHGGQTVVEIDVAPGADELTLANNRTVVAINGVRERLRVLLVSGEPHPGERTWRNLLKADPAVDLIHFTILRPPEKQDGTPVRELSLISFPVQELFEVKLGEFDLIIFDRYRRRGVLPQFYLGNVVEYVHDGGAVLEAAGPAFASPLSLYRTPLAEVLPGAPTGQVYREGFHPRVSEPGWRHPISAILSDSRDAEPTWGRWFRHIETEAERGTVLMQGVADAPLLIVDRVGEGRVAQLLSDHAWLWTRGFEGGGPQAELLRRLAHWLMREPDLEEERLSAMTVGGRLEIIRRSLTPGSPEVTITAPSGDTQTVHLEDSPHGEARGSLAVREVGLYRLHDNAQSAVVAVGALNPKEFADVRATEDVLSPVVAASGGALSWLVEDGLPDIRRVYPGRKTAGRGWIGLQRNERYLVTGIERVPLLPPLLALVLIMGSFALAWRREGR